MRALPELTDGRLYDLLEAGGEQACASARLLVRFVEEGANAPADLAEPERACAKIVDEIRAHLLPAIVTSLPKADIEALSHALAAIPVAAQRFTERFRLAAGNLGGVDFAPPLNWIEELSEIVLDMIRQLRGFESLDRIKDLHPRLLKVADRAEDQTQEIVNRAFQHPASPLVIMMVKDLGDQILAIIDLCREAGGLMNRISLEFL